MTEPRSAHFYLAIGYVIAVWVLILLCLTYHWTPVFKTIDSDLLDGGKDEIHFVN